MTSDLLKLRRYQDGEENIQLGQTEAALMDGANGANDALVGVQECSRGRSAPKGQAADPRKQVR